MHDIVISCALDGIDGDGAGAALGALTAALDSEVAALVPATLKAARKSRRIGTAKELREAIAGLSDGAFSLTFGRDRHGFFDGVAGEAYASLNFGCPGDSPLLAAGAFGGLARAAAAFAADHAANVVVGSYSCLSIRNLGYARTRPPRDYLVADQSSLVDIVDTRVATDGAAADAARALCEGSLPTGVERIVIGDVAILDWSSGAGPSDGRRIAACLTVRDKWLAEHGIGRLAGGWTVEGDAISEPFDGQPHEGLTLYSPSTGVGYLAVHAATPPAERDEAMRSAARLVVKGVTETGASLARVLVVADSRESALALQPEAEAAGLDKVLYATDRHFLDPSPEGNWI